MCLLPQERWIFQWVDRQQEGYNKQPMEQRLKDTQPNWYKKTSLMASNHIHIHTKLDNACWIRSQQTPGPTSELGEDDLKD